MSSHLLGSQFLNLKNEGFEKFPRLPQGFKSFGIIISLSPVLKI